MIPSVYTFHFVTKSVIQGYQESLLNVMTGAIRVLEGPQRSLKSWEVFLRHQIGCLKSVHFTQYQHHKWKLVLILTSKKVNRLLFLLMVYFRASNINIHFLFLEHVAQEYLIAVVIGCVISGLLLILVTIYMVKAGKCCCSKSSSHGSKKDCKPNDLER